ncbi:MAG: hypothetical protein DRP93_00120 [Candidatus Neomarinimicrobiota bacterium]|nr:MAG: hypothetical protein DRP93_00120 [Candidatus Neomarinimicrobiota bacterium]
MHQDFPKQVSKIIQVGVYIVGNCYGITPEHVKKIKRVVLSR